MKNVLTFLQLYPWLWQLIRIIAFFGVAWVIQKISFWLVKPITSLLKLRPGKRVKPERRATLNSLIASGIGMLAYIFAGIATVSLYVEPDTLIWMIGLFLVQHSVWAHVQLSVMC